MSRILVYGDSLSWGYDAATGGRFPIDRVWPAVMAQSLGPDTQVLVEALPGRTTVFDSPYAPGRNGAEMLLPLLESHVPLDLVIVMLGTNDLQEPLGLSARHAASGLWTLLDIALRSGCGPAGGPPKVLALAPPHLENPSGFMGVFYANREAESQELAAFYRHIADRAGVAFFDSASVTRPADVDGVHLDLAGNAALGPAVAQVVRPLLAGP